MPLDQLGALLVTPDAHLITLSDAFVGFVLPSKVHGCIASGKPVVFIGSERSDVHRLCWESGCDYTRVAAGDAVGFARTLEHLADLCEDTPPRPRFGPTMCRTDQLEGTHMKKALVCGAGGFIGLHLVNRLKREAWVPLSGSADFNRWVYGPAESGIVK